MRRILLVLALVLAAAAPADAVPPTRASDRNEVPAAIRHSLARAGAPEAALQAQAEPGADTFIEPVGDLDGDRVNDIVRIGSGVNPNPSVPPTGLYFEAVRGIDRRVLWRHTVAAAWGWAMPARLGSEARSGVLIITYQGVANLAGAYVMTLTAFVGDATTPAWSRTTGLASYGIVPVGFLPLAMMGAGIPQFMGLGEAGQGRAQDMLIHTYNSLFVLLAADEYVANTQIVSGADGMPFAATQGVVNANAEPRAWWMGDLSGDGLDDFVIWRRRVAPASTSVQPYRLEARRGTDGALLWSIEDGPVYAGDPPVNAGDTNGDGIDDVLLNVWGPDFALYDGRNGRPLMRRPGDARPIGDTNRDGKAELLMMVVEPRVATHLSVIDGTRRTLAWTAYRAGLSRGWFRHAITDVDGDRVIDAGVLNTDHAGWSNTRLTSVISGRTTKRLRSGPVGNGLNASVDGGRGHDMYWFSPLYRTDRLTIVDGATGRTIWSVRTAGWEIQTIKAADITGDGRAEVFLTNHTFTRILRGTDGRLI